MSKAKEKTVLSLHLLLLLVQFTSSKRRSVSQRHPFPVKNNCASERKPQVPNAVHMRWLCGALNSDTAQVVPLLPKK